MNYVWAFILIIIIVLSLIFGQNQSFDEGFESEAEKLYLGGSTKCFSCEWDMLRRGGPVYLGKPTKCFSCESDVVSAHGAWAGPFAQNNKCFSCESQYATNPLRLKQKPSRFGLANDNFGIVEGFGQINGTGCLGCMGGSEKKDIENPTKYNL